MSDVTILLAAHGAGDASPSNAFVTRLAGALRDSLSDVEVVCAFRKGEPGFADALTRVKSPRAVVIPIMTSEGFFSTRVLPAALAMSTHIADLDITIAQPLGMHPRFIDFTESLFENAIDDHGLNPADATFVVVGHGTRQHARSQSRTVDVADAVAVRHADWDVRSAFLDEPPLLTDVAATLRERHVVAVPFLIGGGHHASIDIPEQLGIARASSEVAPCVGRASGRLKICARPVGMHATVPSLILEIALAAISESRTGVI